jgi:hypothetical protein
MGLEAIAGDRWQEWLMVTGYITFLGIIVWRVLLTK